MPSDFDVSHDVGKWVASLLPSAMKVLFVETHGRTLETALARLRVKREIVIDGDGWILNWWRTARTRLDDLKAALSELECGDELARRNRCSLDEGDDFEKAVRYHQVVTHCSYHSAGCEPPLTDMIDPIAERLRRIQFLRRPPSHLLHRLEDMQEAVFLVAPPPVQDQREHDDLVAAVASLAGRVAVLGRESDWDGILDDWHRHEPPETLHRRHSGAESFDALWTNYRNPEVRLL